MVCGDALPLWLRGDSLFEFVVEQQAALGSYGTQERHCESVPFRMAPGGLSEPFQSAPRADCLALAAAIRWSHNKGVTCNSLLVGNLSALPTAPAKGDNDDGFAIRRGGRAPVLASPVRPRPSLSLVGVASVSAFPVKN